MKIPCDPPAQGSRKLQDVGVVASLDEMGLSAAPSLADLDLPTLSNFFLCRAAPFEEIVDKVVQLL